MKKIISLMLSLAMLCAMGVTAFADDTAITDQSEEQSATCEVVYYLDSQYCIIIPEQIYASDGEYYFNAQYVSLQDDEQVAVYISPMKDPGLITLSKGNGDTLDMSVYHFFDGGKSLSDDGLVAVFTNSTRSDCSVSFEKVYDGRNRSAGEYSGTFEFTIKIENRA